MTIQYHTSSSKTLLKSLDEMREVLRHGVCVQGSS